MPGDPTGMPSTANPMAGGRSDRRRLIAEAGTWPSMTYPSIWAVWQKARVAGIEISLWSRESRAGFGS